MNDSDLKDAPNTLCENGEGTVTPTQRMQLLTEEQEWKVAELLARQKQEYDNLLKHPVETRQREELIQEARKAAQRAIRESGPEPQAEREAAADGWRNMWIALVVIGAILFLLRLRF
ncbi:MAG: hypothetical protein ACLQNV_19465 [Steroidobacteraceae bacterium]